MSLAQGVLCFLASVVLVLGFCGGDDRRTGNSELDGIIEAVEAGDVASLVPLLELQTLRCGPGMRCSPDGEGAAQPVFETYECEQKWTPEMELSTLLADIAQPDTKLYTAFESTPEYFLPGDHVLVFVGDDPRTDEAGMQRGVALGVRGGRVASAALGCSIEEPIHFMLPHTPVRYLVEAPQ